MPAETGHTPRISIAIITRNRRKYLEECVSSILMQEYPDVEILIGDNGSLDDTREYVEKLQSEHPNVKAFFYERNLGSCEGRNRLLQQATGELWFIIDDDAAFQFKDDLTKCAEEFVKFPKAGAIGFTVVNADDPNTLNLWMYQADPERARHRHFRSAQFASCAVCFRASAMKDAAFSPGEYFVNSFFYS
ncbi:MAG TPA: glycosyltransferase family A protein, partial [Candidatus Kapabacteria bacterium]|nr:glycosyltransferase family A protein [Candidatus Kapabacteria bacterium]